MMKGEMNGIVPYMVALILSLGIVCVAHPYLVRFALRKRIVDNPNARKLNRVPIPVLESVSFSASQLLYIQLRLSRIFCYPMLTSWYCY